MKADVNIMSPNSSFSAWIDFTNPLPVPAGIKPKVVYYKNYSKSGLFMAPFTTSWIKPSPDIVIIPSNSPIYN
jgi:hypothetical protein